MTITPFLIDNIINVYNKTVKLKAENFADKDLEYPQDIVSISASAKKMITENVKKEEKVRKA
jgi:hypothetical protein